MERKQVFLFKFEYAKIYSKNVSGRNSEIFANQALASHN